MGGGSMDRNGPKCQASKLNGDSARPTLLMDTLIHCQEIRLHEAYIWIIPNCPGENLYQAHLILQKAHGCKSKAQPYSLIEILGRFVLVFQATMAMLSGLQVNIGPEHSPFKHSGKISGPCLKKSPISAHKAGLSRVSLGGSSPILYVPLIWVSHFQRTVPMQ